MKRPFGITVLAILAIVEGAFYLYAGTAFLAGSVRSALPADSSTAATVGVVVTLIAGGLAMAAGIGLWMMREWGRRLAMVLVILAMVQSILMIATGARLIQGLLSIAINGLILWYLARRDVRAAFLPHHHGTGVRQAA